MLTTRSLIVSRNKPISKFDFLQAIFAVILPVGVGRGHFCDRGEVANRRTICGIFLLDIGLVWIMTTDGGSKSAARRPFTYHRETTGLEDGEQFFKNDIGHILVKNALIAITLQIKFQAFQFYADSIRRVNEGDGAKIGLTGFGTYRGKFAGDMFNFIVALRMWIRKHLQHA